MSNVVEKKLSPLFAINIDYEKIYYYLYLILAFALPLSRAVISIDITLLYIVWLIEGNFKKI